MMHKKMTLSCPNPEFTVNTLREVSHDKVIISTGL